MKRKQFDSDPLFGDKYLKTEKVPAIEWARRIL